MSGFPRPVSAAQIVAAGGLLAANNLSDVANAGTSRTNLGLGSAATQPTSAFDAAGAAAAVQALSLQKASNLSDVANAGTSRTNLGLGTAATHATGDFAQTANNLSDLASAAAALANISVTGINAQTLTTYTLVLGDLGLLVTLSNAGAITLTVPTNASVAFAVGSEILLAAIGAGQVTVVGAGGVTVNATPGLKLRAQFSYGALVKRATDTWDLSGDLSA